MDVTEDGHAVGLFQQIEVPTIIMYYYVTLKTVDKAQNFGGSFYEFAFETKYEFS